MRSCSGASVAQALPTLSASVETSSAMPSAAKARLCRVSGRCMANLSQTIIASRPGPARPRAMAWCGAGGWVMASQTRQLNFSRTVCTTFHCLGTTSSVSVTSSPSLTRSPVGDHRRCGPGAQRQAVESRRGAVAWALWASLRFLSPLIKPDVRISRIRLPDRLHLKAHGGGPRWTRRRRITPNSPNATVSGKRLVPRDDTLWPVPPSPLRRASSEGSGASRVLSGSSPVTPPCHHQKRTGSQGPLLRRHYPAS